MLLIFLILHVLNIFSMKIKIYINFNINYRISSTKFWAHFYDAFSSLTCYGTVVKTLKSITLTIVTNKYCTVACFLFLFHKPFLRFKISLLISI